MIAPGVCLRKGLKMVGQPNALRRSLDTDCRGKEVFEIQPVVLGGSPTDPANKVVLTRDQHIPAVNYWNKIIKGLRDSREAMARSGALGPGRKR